MKTRLATPKAVQFPWQGQAGLTLVEVLVSLAITGLTVAGVVSGYVFCTTNSVKDSLYLAANTRAMERLEQTRSSRWDTSSWPVVDQLVATNFPDQFVILDLSGPGAGNTTGTVKTAISQISAVPPLRRIRVDCIWQFKGAGLITNTIETCRVPDL